MQHFNSYKHYWFRPVTMVALSFLSFQALSQVFTVDSIMKNGRRSNRINFAYMSDGYLTAQLPTFVTNTTTINTALFSTTPFKEYQNYFNAFAIEVPSIQAGAKHPASAPDEPSIPQPVANPNNYFQSTFDYASIHRLLVPQNNAGLSGVLASNIPDYDQGFIIVNSPYYGGSGGQYATASTDPSSAEIAIHEIGHSFAGLADEYWAGAQYAAEKPNMTANNNPATVKWKNWIGINGIGIYAYGTALPLSNWFRPHQSCKMQILGQPFCSVCSESLVDRIHQIVNMIDDFLPASTSFTLANTNPVSFSVTPITNSTNTIKANWYLNNVLYASNQTSINIPFATFINGSNLVRIEVIDNTTLSKTYLPAAGYVNSTTWTVTKPASLPIVLKSFTGSINNSTGVLTWEIDNAIDIKGFKLEKSKDGINFFPVTSFTGEQNKRMYSYTDLSLFVPYSFYRLQVNEKDGSGFYSNVIRLQNPYDKFYYKVYQNPELHRYHLTTGLTNKENVAMLIADASGKVIMKKDFGKIETKLDYNIELAAQPAGIYFLKLTVNNSNYTVQLLAK